MVIYDTVIIGGGPAGLSAALYLQRFNRKTLVFDSGTGRTNCYEINENYLGFPEGIPARELVKKGRDQAKRFGAHFSNEFITELRKQDEIFIAISNESTYHSKSVILCTGVTDHYPPFTDIDEYLGRSLFWCITCDGYKTMQKTVVVIGQDDEAAVTCLQFKNYTEKLVFCLNCSSQECKISPHKRQNLEKFGVVVVEGKVKDLRGKDGYVTHVVLEDETIIETDFVFSMLGASPNVELAVQLGVELEPNGYIKTDTEQRTNIPGVYAAGDVTRLFSHQIVTAAHEGSMAAQAANYDLYRPEQKD